MAKSRSDMPVSTSRSHPILLLFWAAGVILLGVGVFIYHTAATTPTCAALRDHIGTVREQRLWVSMHCEAQFTVPALEIAAAVAARPPHQRLSTGEGNGTAAGGEQEVVALIVRLSTATLWPEEGGPARVGFRVPLASTPIARLFTSLAATLETGFRYRVYAVWDAGDEVYDGVGKVTGQGIGGHATTHDALSALFDSVVAGPCGAKGIPAAFIGLSFPNRLGSEGPCVNYGVGSAVSDGADYVMYMPEEYVFKTAWAAAMVADLTGMSPSRLGVTSTHCPGCPGNDKETLNTPMVHRTHFDAFPTFWPPSLTYGYALSPLCALCCVWPTPLACPPALCLPAPCLLLCCLVCPFPSPLRCAGWGGRG